MVSRAGFLIQRDSAPEPSAFCCWYIRSQQFALWLV